MESKFRKNDFGNVLNCDDGVRNVFTSCLSEQYLKVETSLMCLRPRLPRHRLSAV